MTVTRHPLLNLFTTTALASALMFAWTAPAHAQQRNSIVERYTTYQDFQTRMFGFLQNDFRVVDLEICREPGAVWWVASYQRQPNFSAPGGFDHFLEGGQTNFMTDVNQMAAQGWFIDDMDAQGQGAGWNYFVGVLNPGQGQQVVIDQQTWPSFRINWLAGHGGNLRLRDVDVTRIGNRLRYFGVQRTGTYEEQLLRETTWAAFTANRIAQEGAGWRLTSIAATEGEYIGVLNRRAGPSTAERFDDWATLLTRFGEIDHAAEMRIEDVECWMEGGALRYAALWRAIPSSHPEANVPTTRLPAEAEPQRRRPRPNRRPPAERSPGN